MENIYNRAKLEYVSSSLKIKIKIKIKMVTLGICLCLEEITGNNREISGSGDPENRGTPNNQ